MIKRAEEEEQEKRRRKGPVSELGDKAPELRVSRLALKNVGENDLGSQVEISSPPNF